MGCKITPILYLVKYKDSHHFCKIYSYMYMSAGHGGMTPAYHLKDSQFESGLQLLIGKVFTHISSLYSGVINQYAANARVMHFSAVAQHTNNP